MTVLNNETPIDLWRRAKERGDGHASLKATLGCVGKPVYEVLADVLRALPQDVATDLEVRLVWAARESRQLLAGMLEQFATEKVEEHVENLSEWLKDAEFDTDMEYDGTETLDDLVRAGIELAGELIHDFHVPDYAVDGEEL